MKTAVLCMIGLVGSWGPAAAESLVEGRVRLDSGQPVPGARVLLFDLTDLRAAPLAATTDGSGRFTLPLGTLAGALPERFELGANYPNPFNPSTMIPYQLPAAMPVRLEVFNILGQQVATLVDGDQPAGFHTVSWDATDAAGEAVGAGVYLYRLSGDGVQATRSMLLIDGQAGIPWGGSTGSGGEVAEEAGGQAPVYGLTVSGLGLVPHVDPAFRVEAGMAPVDVVVTAPAGVPASAKAASSGGILGDVDNTGGVDFFDALLVALYSRDSSIVMPNNGDITLGDVNADGQVDLSDAWVIAAWLNDPSDPSLPAGIGAPLGPAASLSPDPSTVAFTDDGSWHRFTVEAGEAVSVVVNPTGTPRRLEITTRSGRGNFCPAEADDEVSRQDGQTLYLSGCTEGSATVELRREGDGTLLQTYTFEVTASPADLVVESVSASDSTLTPGQSFTLGATVRNQGTGPSAATTLRYYRSSNRTISTQDTRIGTDAVSALAASGTSVESIRLTAPSGEGIYYYGACVVSVAGESGGNNCSSPLVLTVSVQDDDALSSPPPTWVFAGDISEEDQTALREEMEDSRAYFSDRFGVEATGFTVLVGADYEALSPVYREVVGISLSDAYPPFSITTRGWVTVSRTGGAVVTLIYGKSQEALATLEHMLVHEYFHVLQGQLASGFATLQDGEAAYYSGTSRGPVWLREGLASYADYAYTPGRPKRRPFLNDRYTPYADIVNFQREWGEISLRGMSEEDADYRHLGCSFGNFYVYAMGFAASVYLVEQAEEDSYVNYWTLLGQRPTWQRAFEEAFGIGVSDFYRAFDEWLPAQLPPPPVTLDLQIRWTGTGNQLQPGSFLWVEIDKVAYFPSGTSSTGWYGDNDLPTLTITYDEGVVGTGYLSLWWYHRNDLCTEYLLGWYKDGELVGRREDATAVEFTGRSSTLDWSLPGNPDTLPRLAERKKEILCE